MTFSHPGGREGSTCSPLPFPCETKLRVACVALVGRFGLVELFGLGSIAWSEPRLLGATTVQQAWWKERAELEAELLVAEICSLATTQLTSLAPSIEDSGMNPAFSCFVLTNDFCQPIPAPEIVAIGTAVTSSSRCAVTRRSPWSAGAFLCGGRFWDDRGRGRTGQPVGPYRDAAIMTTVVSTNRVDLGSFSSRYCAFRRTHTNADPLRLLCIRLALPLTLSLPSRFAPSPRLMVGVSLGVLWLLGPSSCGCTFWDDRGGEHTRQPLGPLVDTSTITIVTSTDHVDSGTCSSRFCTFRGVHMSADPIWLLCIRLA